MKEKAYVVIPKRLKEGGVDYEVVNTLDGTVAGSFGCDKWAQTHADELNKED